MKTNSSGFTLVEVILALFLIAVGVIATAPLFVYATKENAVGGDLGSVGAAAVRQMERMRHTPYYSLQPGGHLDNNLTGYFDDSDPDAVVRWLIVDNPNPPAETKIVTVRAIAARQVVGQPKRVTLVTMRGE